MAVPIRVRKKPVEVEAMLNDPDNCPEDTAQWILDYGGVCDVDGNAVLIDTMEGTMRAEAGDYVIRGVKGEFYPCKPDIFVATYDYAGLTDESKERGHLEGERE